MNIVSLTIDSCPTHVPLVGVCAKEMAVDYFSVDHLSEIEQALVELVNNCIEHAYSGQNGCQITVQYMLENDRLVIKVTDQGKQFDPKRLENLDADFDYDPLDIDNLPEGGFGLKIIKSCMDEVLYNRINGNNQWSLTKYI